MVKLAWFRRAVSRCPPETQRERAGRLASAINEDGHDLYTLVEEDGFRTTDFIENFGFTGGIDYIFRNANNAKDILNDAGISNVALLSAGVTDTSSGYDFSNFSVSNLVLQNDRVRLTQVAAAVTDVTDSISGGSSTLPLSTDARLVAGVEMSNLYNGMSDYQKNNAEALVTRVDPNFGGLLGNNIFNSFLNLIV